MNEMVRADLVLFAGMVLLTAGLAGVTLTAVAWWTSEHPDDVKE